MSVLITGISSGIGLAVGERLAGHIVGVARNAEKMEKLPFHCLAGDVKDPNLAQAVCDFATKLSPLTGLVCSAGTGGGGSTESLASDKWNEVIDTNLTGAFSFVQAALKKMLPRGSGNIVLISSTAGIYGYKRNAAYCASKHGLIGLARAVMKEHGRNGIKIFVVCPGFVETPMTDRMLTGIVKHQGISIAQAREKVSAVSPQNRIIPVTEIAEMVVDLVNGRFPSLAGQPIIMGDGE